MLDEVSQGLWMFYVFSHTPTVDRNEENPNFYDIDDADEKKVTIVGVNRRLRFVLICFLALPKLAIAAWISWVGAKFLVLAVDTGALVLKALSCAYFVSIDELIFNAYTSIG